MIRNIILLCILHRKMADCLVNILTFSVHRFWCFCFADDFCSSSRDRRLCRRVDVLNTEMMSLKEHISSQSRDMKLLLGLFSKYELRLLKQEKHTKRRIAYEASKMASRFDDLANSTTSRLADLDSSTTLRLDDLANSTTSRLDDLASSTTSRVDDLANSTTSRLHDITYTTRSRLDDVKVALEEKIDSKVRQCF